MATTFCTAKNCIDGRTQLPVINWLSQRFDVEQVDLITEVSLVRVLALDPGSSEAMSICRQVDVSIQAHNSRGCCDRSSPQLCRKLYFG